MSYVRLIFFLINQGDFFSLDDKLFSFWHLQGDAHPFSHVKGIYRFETGIKVNEFRDLRANPRCLLESQVLSLRVKYAKMLATGVLGTPRTTAVQRPLPGRSTSLNSPLGLAFDPYDPTPLPQRVLATGAAANFPSVANLVCDVFNSAVFVPTTQVASAQVVPHRNAPAAGYPSRAALGGAYVARWVWGKEWGPPGGFGFEEEVRRLLGKRWVGSGGVALRTHVNGGAVPTGSVSGSGASTPFGSVGVRSGLGDSVLLEEEEDEENARELERQRNANGSGGAVNGGGRRSPGVIGGGNGGSYGFSGRGFFPLGFLLRTDRTS